jgi:hypothetical protein
MWSFSPRLSDLIEELCYREFFLSLIKRNDFFSPLRYCDSFIGCPLISAVRLAHSVRKDMLFAVVDDEGDVTYYSLSRERP